MNAMVLIVLAAWATPYGNNIFSQNTTRYSATEFADPEACAAAAARLAGKPGLTAFCVPKSTRPPDPMDDLRKGSKK